jgi:hypothetical protein
LKKLKMTPEQWWALLGTQQGRCGVCQRLYAKKLRFTLHEGVLQCSNHIGTARRLEKFASRRDEFVAQGERECGGCHAMKSLDDYPAAVKTRAGKPRYSYCKECHSKSNRRISLKKLFNLTPEEYDTILAFQGGVCAICQQPPKSKRLSVDHCHRTGLIRGALCSFCNRAIAVFMDNVERLDRAVAFLRNPTATQALGAPRYGLIGRVSNKAATRKRLNKHLIDPAAASNKSQGVSS